MSAFGAVYLLISHQMGKLQHLFLFLSAHDMQPDFPGSNMLQILAADFFGGSLWLCNRFRHFNMKETDDCVPKQ